MSREVLLQKISDVQTESNEAQRRQLWAEVLHDIHQQVSAIVDTAFLPTR